MILKRLIYMVRLARNYTLKWTPRGRQGGGAMFKRIIANFKNLLKTKNRANTSQHGPATSHLRIPHSQDLFYKMDDSWNVGWKRTS